jgi:phenylacetate-CoA ligase
MVRFRLGDVAAWSSQTCSCGRGMPLVKEVFGRIEDVVIGPDGRRIAQFYGVFVGLPHVREGQVLQESRERIRLRVVVTQDFNATDGDTLVARMRQRLGEGIEIVVDVVDEIPRHKSGKFQQVVSLLDRS